MATNDDDWKNFLDSVNDTDDEVETGTPEDETKDDVEENQEDDADKSPAAGDEEEGESKEEDSEEDKESEDDSEDPPAYKSKLSQFHNSDGNVDIEKLEKAYIENSKEALKMKGTIDQLQKELEDLKRAKETGKQEPAGKTQQQHQPPRDPIVAHTEAQLKKQYAKDFEEFTTANPDSITDPVKREKITRFIARFSEDYAADNGGELPSMREALETCYRYYNWPMASDKEQKKEAEQKAAEDLSSAAKKRAATSRAPQGSNSSKGKRSGGETTKLEAFFADKLGVKLDD